MHTAFLPKSTGVVVSTLAKQGWQMTYERRLLGALSREVTWAHKTHGTLHMEVWSTLLASRFHGDLPPWFESVEPHALTLEDLQAVVAADIPVSERIEACVQTGIFFVGQDIDEAYVTWLKTCLNDRAELQLAALEVVRVLGWLVFEASLTTLAAQGTLYVKNLAAEVLADVMLGQSRDVIVH